MVAEGSRIPRSRAANVAVASVLLMGLSWVGGCLSPPPSRESAPSSAPTPAAPTPGPAPAPAEPAPAVAPAPPPASAEGKASSGAEPRATPIHAEKPRPAQPSRDQSAPKKKARARNLTAEESADSELGNAAAAPRGPAALHSELERADRAATPDCPAARERKKAVCDLAGQICRLTDRDPNVASVAEYCSDARQRCSDAERRTAERCPD